MLTKEIPDVSAIETAGEHDGRSSKLSIVELFMSSCWPRVSLVDALILQEMLSWLGGGHWGLSETENPAKIFTKTEKQEEKSLKTEKTPRVMIKTANS